MQTVFRRKIRTRNDDFCKWPKLRKCKQCSESENVKLRPVHTYPDLCENASSLSVLGSCPHGDGVFSYRKRSFSKTLSRVDLFENTVFMLSHGRVKTEVFENADVTVSIYCISEHALGSLGMTRRHYYYYYSFIYCWIVKDSYSR